MHAKSIRTLSRVALMAAMLPVTAIAADTDPAITQPPHRMGEHPAVLVGRDWDKRGYDYASKFYLHPARLEVLSEATRERGEHPAVLVVKQWRKRGYEEASTIAAHPALLSKAAAVAPARPELTLGHSAAGASVIEAQARERSDPSLNLR